MEVPAGRTYEAPNLASKANRVAQTVLVVAECICARLGAPHRRKSKIYDRVTSRRLSTDI